MKPFTLALPLSCLAVNPNTRAQNAAENSRQQPTIEDRLTQLEQKQDDLAGRVDALDQKITELQREIEELREQGGSNASERSVRPSNAPQNNSSRGSRTTQDVSYDVFYDRLQSDGRWFNDETYGYVWQPNTASADQNWRPYTDGRWVYTDRGWTWVSNENFGWATYHYGRWARLSGTGWVWVPGSRWAPAWVSWRQSDDYVGWAPLPPETESEQDVKIEGWADNYYNIGPTSYNFLKISDLGNRSYRGLVTSPHDTVDFISRTRNVTNIYYGNGSIIDNGPNYEQLVQQSNVKIDRYRLAYVQQNDPQAQFVETVRGDQLQVIAPAAQIQRMATVEPKVAGNVSQAQIDRGWQGIDEAKAQQLKQTWKKETPVPASLPAKPEPPKPVIARAAAQQGEPTATENRQQNPPAATQPNQAATPAPSPSPVRSEKAAQPAERAVQPAQQQPEVNQQRHESKQAEHPKATPSAQSPAAAEKGEQTGRQLPAASEESRKERTQGERQEISSPNRAIEKSERGQPSPSENRRREAEEAERSHPGHAATPASKHEQPGQSEVKPRGENVESFESSRKSNTTERPAAGESKSQGREQSESEKPAKKRTDEVEKKNPLQPPQ
jgi:uncharacterized protein DUF6600